jgi:hypothetical protein
MGADLKIVAHFPGHDVEIRNFRKLAGRPDDASESQSRVARSTFERVEGGAGKLFTQPKKMK